MKQKILLLNILITLCVLFNSEIVAQNMSHYITLGVNNGEDVKFKMTAKNNNTAVKIKSGTLEYNLTVGLDWSPYGYYRAGASEMTIYGDVTSIRCSETNINALDVSHNNILYSISCFGNQIGSLDVSQNLDLEGLYCHDNALTTEKLDELFCSLPDRTGLSAGYIEPINNENSDNLEIVLATNKHNAEAKNWVVAYYEDDTDIPETDGTYECASAVDNVTALNITIYPNPVTDILNITADTDKFTVKIYNVLGKLVNISTNSNKISVNDLSSGVYTLEIITDEGVYNKKFIKK